MSGSFSWHKTAFSCLYTSSCAPLYIYFVQFFCRGKDLYSTHVAFWEFTNLATMTKSYNPFYFKYHCFCLCCDRAGLQKPLLSSQLSGCVLIIQVLMFQEKSSHWRLHLLLFPPTPPLYSEYK